MMDTERIVYDTFAHLYDRGDHKRDGKSIVSVRELLAEAGELEPKEVLVVLNQWIGSRFIANEDGGPATESSLLRVRKDGETFFKTKYRV